MSFAEDMNDLRREIETLRTMRTELRQQLRDFRMNLLNFRQDLHNSVTSSSDEIRRSLAEQGERGRTMRRNFVEGNVVMRERPTRRALTGGRCAAISLRATGRW